MKVSELARPDRILLKSLSALSDFATDLYSDQKQRAKASAKLTYIGETKIYKVDMQLFSYGPKHCEVTNDIEDYDFINDPNIHWLNVDGVHNVELVTGICEKANLDRLTVRQILDTTQRPKIEDMETYLSINLQSTIMK